MRSATLKDESFEQDAPAATRDALPNTDPAVRVGFDAQPSERPSGDRGGLDSLSLFFSDVGRRPLLTRAGEQALALRIAAGRRALLEAVAVFPPAYDLLEDWKKDLEKRGQAPWSYREVGVDLPDEPEEDETDGQALYDDQYEALREESITVFAAIVSLRREAEFGLGIGSLPGAVRLLSDAAILDERLHELSALIEASAKRLANIDGQAARAARAAGADMGEFAEAWKAWDPAPAGAAVTRIGPKSEGRSVSAFVGDPRFADSIALARDFVRDVRLALPLFRRLAALARKAQEEIHLAKGEFADANYRLVISIAKKHSKRGVALADLVQDGNLGLLRAIDKFDYRRGFKFSTYAVWWIRQAIARSVADTGRTIRLPVHRAETLSKAVRAAAKFRREHGREPDESELAKMLGLPADKVRDLLDTVRDPISLDMPIGGDDDDLTLSAFIADPDSPDPGRALYADELRALLSACMMALKPREERVLRMRFGLNLLDYMTLDEVAECLGVTRERVRQIESKGLRKMRRPTYARRLRSAL